MRTFRIGCIALICVIAAHADEAMRVQRLTTLAEVWGKAYLFHPKVITSGVDWRGALIDAIPQVESARTSGEYRDALNRMLARLDDPLTAVQSAHEVAPVGPGVSSRLLAPGVGYLDATEPRNYRAPDFQSQTRKLIADLGDIRRVVIDLRWRSVGSGQWVTNPATDWLRMFYTQALVRSSRVSRLHEGWTEQGTRRPGGYEQRWMLTPSDKAFVPDRPVSIQAVFLTNYPAADWLEEELGALQACGHAVLFEPTGALPGSALTEGLIFNINMRPAISQNGILGFHPDATLPSLDDVEAVVKTQPRTDLTPFSPFAWSFPQRESVKQEISREERLYGLFKSWVVLRCFFGQPQFATVGWEQKLSEWIPRVEAAESRDAYYDVLARWTVLLNDTHVFIDAGTAPARFVPAALAFIAGKLIVRKVAPGAGDLQVGDEILSFDGTTVSEFERYWKARISLSTPQAFLQYYIYRPLWGPKDSEVELRLLRDGRELSVRARRTAAGLDTASKEPSYRLLAGNVGYINLSRVSSEAELDRALAALATTRGLLLDMRGYPQVGLWYAIASRLIERPTEVGSSETPLVYEGQRQGWRGYTYNVEPHETARYRMPVVMLINDMALSAAESIIAAAKSTGRVKLVGSATKGANGNTSRVSLPGGGDFVFDVARHFLPGRTSYQNVGIQPDVLSVPTVAGIKAGRDEVLERGLEIVRSAER